MTDSFGGETMHSQAGAAGSSGEMYCPTCEKQFSAGQRCPIDQTKLVRLASTVDPFLGRELEGRYTILQKLGQGGMGAVYRASQHSVGRDVAVKVVTPSLVSNSEVIKRFLRECKLASRLSHPNAIGVLDFGQTSDGVFFLVMELVSGRTLDDVMESEKKLRPDRVIRIGMQICDALEGAHGMNIVHRDLKPSNVMLLASGRDMVKVLDFGLAKSLAPDSTQSTMTNAGALMGTPAFMPPELATGQPCDGRADLYSLGCMLYYMGSGRLPFYSDSIHELVAKHATDPAPPMNGVPAALAAVVDRMLLKNPADRFQSAAVNREALEEAMHTMRESRPIVVAPSVMDTRISLGPFPASSAEFKFLKSDVHAAMSETFLGDESVQADVALPVAAIGRRAGAKRWLAGAALLISAGTAGFVVTRRSGSSESVSATSKAVVEISRDAALAKPDATIIPVIVAPIEVSPTVQPVVVPPPGASKKRPTAKKPPPPSSTPSSSPTAATPF
jgi:eukaryotic-like serine/threonine-protein kinase